MKILLFENFRKMIDKINPKSASNIRNMLNILIIRHFFAFSSLLINKSSYFYTKKYKQTIRTCLLPLKLTLG